MQRLDTIAEMQGGHAKLHSRLFQQWMHHAYPNECSFPSLANETAPTSTREAQESPKADALEVIPWSDYDEDYLTCQGPPKEVAARSTHGIQVREIILVIIV